MAKFDITVDTSAIAEKVNKTKEVVEQKLTPAMERLSISTHAFIINKANNELSDFKRKFFLGVGEYGKKTLKQSSSGAGVDETAKNVRWVKVSNGIWVVEIDESAAWIEEGREPTSMATEDWLLKPGKAKVAKDGSLYRAIPFKITEGGKEAHGTKPAYASIIKGAMKEQGIPIKKIERNEDGTPKLGIIHKLNIEGPQGGWEQFPGMHSRPRTAEESAMSGLKPHKGIFHLKGAVVVQRMKPGKKPKPVKETVVFRIVSSKHKLENRWMYPEVKPFNAIPAAYDYAKEQLDKIIKSIEEELAR
jgi:hypothetical protein